MTKRVETIPPYNYYTKKYSEKIAFYDFFEPLVGYTQVKRSLLGHLYSDGFRVEHWLKLLKFLKTSDKPIGELYWKVIKHKLSVKSTGMLWVLIHSLENETFNIYLDTQVKAQAKESFLNFTYIGNRFGISTLSSSSIYKEVEPYTKTVKAIRKALEDCYEMSEEVLKIRSYKYIRGVFEIKFGKKTVLLGRDNSKGNFTYENLSALHKDIMHSEKTILEILEQHNFTNSASFILFDAFNPDKVMQEMELILENMIVENELIHYLYDALCPTFGVKLDKRSSAIFKSFKNRTNYEALVQSKINEQKERLEESNLNMLRRRTSTFKLLGNRRNRVASANFQIDFHECACYVEWAELASIIVIDKSKSFDILYSLSRLFNYIISRKKIKKTFSTKDIEKRDIVAYLNDENTSENEVKIVIPAYRNFIILLQDREELNRDTKMGILPKAPKHDASQGIIPEYKDSGNFQAISDEVHEKIMLHRKELEPTIENAYITIAELGIRPNELEGITPESKIEEGGKTKIVIWQFKSEKAHAKKGKKPIRKVPASILAINAFDEQVKISEDARKTSGEDCIFVRKFTYKLGYSIVGADTLRHSINLLVKRHYICDPITGALWHYTPYQLRVKLVVEMIENGADHEQLRAFMGHLGDRALEKAYAMVEKLKLMDFDTEFFEKEFSMKLPQESINQYSEEDLKEIVTLLLATSRKMMYGTCTRHPIQGDCGKLHEATSCAPCENLKTDPSNRKDWEALYTEQCKRVFNLRKWYLERDVKEEGFETFELYIKETGKLWSYASVLFNMQHKRSWRVEL